MPQNDVKNTKMTEKDMRADIDNMVSDLDNRNMALNTRKIVMENTLGNKREAVIRSLMEMIQQLGVDPTDESAIEELEEQLRFQNPDLAELLRTALERLLSEKATGQEAVMPNIEEEALAPNQDQAIPIDEAVNIMGRYQGMLGRE